MKRLMLALFCIAALVPASQAESQTEGRPCTPEPTDELIAYGDFITCAIDVLGDSDLFRFQGTVGEVVTVRVTEQGLFPWCAVELFRPDLSPVAPPVIHSTACEIRITLDTSGLFTIRVTEFGNNDLMSYALELDRLSPPSPVARPINPGDTFSNNAIDPRGDADLFIFNGVSGDMISLRVTDAELFPWPVLELFRPDGTLVDPPGAVFHSTTAAMDITLDQTGVFTARVSEFGNNDLMTYNIEYQCLAGLCLPWDSSTLTVERHGAGLVTSSPGGISCGTDCFEPYSSGTVVTLTATPDAGWTFNGWSGDAGCSDGIVTVTGAVACTATFVPIPPTHELYDGDGKADIAVWRPSNGTWYVIRSSDGSIATRPWGAPNDVPVPGDYDGDGKPDIAVWRPSTGVWYIVRSSDGVVITHAWGAGFAPFNDVAVPADYDGDGKTDIAIWRASTGVWYIIKSSDGGLMVRAWGAGFSPYNDIPVPADYDGDGQADVAVWRASTGVWFILRSSDGVGVGRHWGTIGDVPVPGDYDGDGKRDIAVWRPSSGIWFIIRSSDDGMTARQWGAGFAPYNDVPVPADYDGDGKTDIAVWRGATGIWYVIRSSDDNFLSVPWGAPNDVTVPR